MSKISQIDVLLKTLENIVPSEQITQKSRNLIKSSAEHLAKLYNANISKEFELPKQQLYLCYEALKKYYILKQQDSVDFFSKGKNIKRLIVALNLEFEEEKYRIIDSQYYSTALKIVFDTNKFRKSFIPLLIRVILESWGNAKIYKIIERIKILVKSNEQIDFYKQNPILKYTLSDDCLATLLKDIINNDITIDITNNNTNSISSFLHIGSYFSNTQFFHSFFIAFTLYITRQKLLTKYYTDIESILYYIQNKDVSKRVIPIIVQYCEKKGELELKENLINLAFKMIGNPSIEAYWLSIDSGEESELTNLKLAQTILNRWLANKFLTVFFNNLSNDTDNDRKNYWLKYVDFIVDFKILVMRKNYNYLLKLMQGVPREYVTTKVAIVTNNSKYIFILKFRNKTIIEFSTTGNSALIYGNNDRNCPNIDRKEYNYNHFKMTMDDPLLFRKDGYSINKLHEYGRLFHKQGWEICMDKWINNYLDFEKYD